MIAAANSWRDALSIYLHRRVVGMLFLGFSAGLPFPLVFSTFTTWLRDVGISRTTIGFLTAVGLAYALKVLWSPIVDRFELPLLTRKLGQRRSWMLFAQFMIVLGLVLMAMSDPLTQLTQVALAALLVAFSSATQDVAIDAYRIEAVDADRQSAMAATYIYGYRIAMIVSVAGALYLADYVSWSAAYFAMAGFMIVGVITTLIIAEPDRIISPLTLELERKMALALHADPNSVSVLMRLETWFVGAVVGPFADFFQRNGTRAAIILTLVSVYLVSDYILGIMANPFYIDMGYTKTEIANVAKLFGLAMTLIGAGVGGILAVRFGVMRILLVGAILLVATNMLFVWLASSNADLWRLAVVVAADNMSGGVANVAFIAYLSSLTNTAYTATQYALFSSLMKIPGKIAGLFSGLAVDTYGYPVFFLAAAATGIPAILIVIYMLRTEDRKLTEKAT